MLWLTRLQQRLSLTKNEAVALLCLSGLLSIGLIARYVQQHSVPVPVGAYDEMDRMFFDLSVTVDSLGDSSFVAGSAGPGLSAATAAPIDINTADAATLETLPRVGPTLAERIIAFRTTYGPFAAVEDLGQVRGIGAKTIEILRPLVYAAPDAPAP